MLRIILLMCVCVVMGCVESSNLKIVEYDGCEYFTNEIYIVPFFYNIYTHKGNCKNPIHSRSVE